MIPQPLRERKYQRIILLLYRLTTTQSRPQAADVAVDIATGTITVNPLDELTTTSATAQVVCSATAITPIQYTLGGGATGATISWDVDPVSITLDAATTTISGNAPTVTTSTTYTYTLTSTGGSCPDTATGTITVNPDGVITHDNSSGCFRPDTMRRGSDRNNCL